MLTAIYTRVSTGIQATEGHSLDVQLEQCLAYAQKCDVPADEIRVFREAGASGEDMDRPALMEMLDLAATGRLGRVIVKHPDRLSRNVSDKAIIVRELQKHHVELHFVDVPNWNESDEAVLLFHIISSIAEYELRQIRRRTLSGKLRAARQGQVMPSGIDPYGYRYEDGRLVIVPEEAAFVRMMYRWYGVEGASLREIARRLDALGAPTKTRISRQWSHATVAHILRSPLYRGEFLYNRRVTRKTSASRSHDASIRIDAEEATKTHRERRRRVVGWREQHEWIRISVPAIVDPSLVDLVYRRLSVPDRTSNPPRPHMLSGKLVCARCHQVWQAVASSSDSGAMDKRRYRRPAERDAKHPRCVRRCKRICAEDVEAAVWQTLVEALLASQVWADGWGRARRDEVRFSEEIVLLKQQESRLQRSRARLTNLYACGDLHEVAYHEQRSDLEAQQSALAGEIEVLQTRARELQRMHRMMRQRVEAWLRQCATTRLRRRFVEQLVDSIEIDVSRDAIDLTVTLYFKPHLGT